MSLHSSHVPTLLVIEVLWLGTTNVGAEDVDGMLKTVDSRGVDHFTEE
jgi:hypothetical protein